MNRLVWIFRSNWFEKC